VHPLVLITTRDADNLALLKSVALEEIVWIREMEGSLLAALERACLRGPMIRLALELEQADHLAAPLHRALVIACRSERPFRSVAGLAGMVGRDRRTLSTHWRHAIGSGSSVRLEDFIDWILLLHAATRWAVGLKATAVAVEMGVHEQTLSRMAKRLAGRSPSAVRATGRRELLRSFQDQVVAPLLRKRLSDILQ
jgi:hypothetical protein